MAPCAAVGFAGSFVWAVLPMAALLHSGAAIRELVELPYWVQIKCDNEKFRKALKLQEKCDQETIEEVCESFFTKLAAATSRVKYGQLFYSEKRVWCKRYNAVKEDVIYEAEHPKPRTIKKAAQACEPMAWKNCVAVTCPTFCALKNDKNCDCKKMCKNTFQKMWKTGSIGCAPPNSWGKCLDEHRAQLEKEDRIPELEAISREHILKCVCVSRLKNDDMCYTGSQGITPGQRWCDFNKNPSWRRLLAAKKPTDGSWPTDWVEHQPDCSLKEPLADEVLPGEPLFELWKDV